jgi:hypothetical protein
VDQQQAATIATDEWTRLGGGDSWAVTESSPYGPGLWLVVLADDRREHFATLVLDEQGHADVVCLEDYRPCA